MENESNKKKSTLSKAKNTTKKYSRRVPDNTMFSDNDYVHEQLDRLTYAMEAFKAGDISVRLSKERNDKFADLAEAYNSMVEMIGGIGTEVSRISKVSGIEGNLDAQIVHKEEEGVWKDLIDDTNTLIKSIHKPVQEVSRIANNIAKGIIDEKYDLTSVSGDFRSMAESINRSLGNLTIFSKQVIQLAHEVGIEGKLGGQASVHNVSGVWLNITSNINLMSDNLTQQVREIVGLTNLVVNGDLSKRISEEGKGGEVLELTHTINEMVSSLNIFSSEVIRVAKEVGTEGILGGQANVPDVSGIWKDLTEGVNLMAFNLTSQVREIAEVAKAVANGNLNKKIAIIVQGEVKDLKYTINGMVDSLIVFSSEVGRVTREVGTEGWLGGQALVPGVTGTWAELTNNVNIMASNITSQVREIATVATAVANGDLGQKIAEEGKGGEILDLSLTINNMVDSLNIFSEQISKVVRDVGIEGKLGGEAKVPNLAGTWFDITSHINMMSGNLTQQVREISQVATAVVKGDLSHKITINAKGEIAELKSTINEMVDSLNIFSGEVIRVASEVGIEGKLGGKARIPNVAGTWKTLLDSVNIMTSNLTLQVRQIAYVTQAILNGDLSQKITITADGEIAELKNTINEMVDFLSVLASGVTNVSKEVGVEGILGGQALVPGAIGAWKKLTDTVNLMASNLTFQVRNIAGVSTALAQGDFSKKINVEVRGEVKELKSNINSMVDSFNTLVESTNAIANGNFSVEMPLRGENDQLSTALNSMTNSLRSISNENEMEAWIKTGQSGLNDSMRGEQD